VLILLFSINVVIHEQRDGVDGSSQQSSSLREMFDAAAEPAEQFASVP
jgi:hypothetical protein